MATATQQHPHDKDATKSPNEMFRYSAWLHVGVGAETCEEGETGSCGNPLHFHAWVRLPNQLQHEDIRERALAAKARRIRQLRDPEADAHEILESDMAELARVASIEDLVAELVNKDWWKRQLEAMQDVEENEDYKTIDKDRDRLHELRAMDPDARPRDELDELERHMARYSDAIQARRDELEQPIRASFQSMSKDELVALIREERVSAEASSAFMETYSRWSWMAGTYTNSTPVGRQRSFSGIEQLTEAAPEVLEALRATFGELEASLQRGAQGN